MSVVVSANYLDRRQKNWIVRHEKDPVGTHELRDAVAIRDFEFQRSKEEAGFGCSVIAVGQMVPADVEIDRANLIKIEFEDYRFVECNAYKEVRRGELLVCDQTGIYYLPS